MRDLELPMNIITLRDGTEIAITHIKGEVWVRWKDVEPIIEDFNSLLHNGRRGIDSWGLEQDND